MNFRQRLKYYGFGFVLGAIILTIIVSKRGCRSLNEMKVTELISQMKIIHPKARCKLNALGIGNDTILIETLKKYRVNNAESDIHHKPCGIYKLVPLKPDSAMFNLTICDCDTVSTISDIEVFPKYKVNCDSVK